MQIRTAHHGQDFDLVCAHAFERQIKPLVGVDVRKILGWSGWSAGLCRRFWENTSSPSNMFTSNTRLFAWLHHSDGTSCRLSTCARNIGGQL
jgi:hypothetical protein